MQTSAATQLKVQNLYTRSLNKKGCLSFFLQIRFSFSIQFAGVVLPRLPYTWHSLEKFLQHILSIAFEK